MIDGVRKFYIRYRENAPAEEMHYLAERGFRELGIETEPYLWNWCSFDGELPEIPDFGPEVGVAGYLDDVWSALAKANKPKPDPFDYPTSLRPWLGRKIKLATLGEVRGTLTPTFIKPVEHKLFTGFVHKGDGESRMRLVRYSGKDDDKRWRPHSRRRDSLRRPHQAAGLAGRWLPRQPARLLEGVRRGVDASRRDGRRPPLQHADEGKPIESAEASGRVAERGVRGRQNHSGE